MGGLDARVLRVAIREILAMTTPTLEARLAKVLPCYECHPVEHRTGCPAVHRPAILALIRTLLREERERCAEVALRRVAPDSPDHVAADCTECHDGLMLARDIRALEDRP